MGNEIINHLMYADDLVIMAPSVAGLSKLLRICELFGASHDMIFNQKKSASVCFISKTLKGAHLPNVYLNGEVILQVDSVKYLGHHLTNDLHYMNLTYADNVVPLMFVATFFSGNVTYFVVYRFGEIEVIQFLLRFYVYSSLVVELQENVNLQVANNLSQHTKNEHRIV